MSSLDTSKLVGQVKDSLHKEWAEFKISSQLKPEPVCLYAVGGIRDNPVSVLGSACNSVRVVEGALKDTVDLTVERSAYILASEVVANSDGRLFLYPERRSKKVQPSKEVPVVTNKNQRTKTLQTPEQTFMTFAEQVGNYILDHLKRVSEVLLLAGNIKSLCFVLSSAILVKSYLTQYKEALKYKPGKAYNEVLKRCDENIDLMTQHILTYHCDLLRSALLHDNDSHDWNNSKPYFENERISMCINMWAFYLQGLRNDLWRYTSPRLGETILATVFTDTLELMVSRYAQIEPSYTRMLHYRGDLITIFLIAAEILPSLMSSPVYFFKVGLHDSVVFLIHRRMDLLLRIAALKTAPLECLVKAFGSGIRIPKKPAMNYRSCVQIQSTPEWLTFLNPTLYPSRISRLSSLPKAVAIYHVLLNAASQPTPSWNIIIRGLLMGNCLGSKTILEGLFEFSAYVSAGKACNGAFCLLHLCTSSLLPHTVFASVCQVLLSCIHGGSKLTKILSAILCKATTWGTFDRTQVWNIQRPPWHHALVLLVAPHVASVVAQVLRSVPPEPPAQPAHPSQCSVRLEQHLSGWTTQLILGVDNVASSFPSSLVHVAEVLDKHVPSDIKPVGGHAICQLVISAIYSILNSRSSLDQLSDEGPITDGQWNMLVAVGERLCSLHEGNYELHLRQMHQSLILQLQDMEEEELDCVDDYIEEEVIEGVFISLSTEMLSSLQGQQALGLLWLFLRQNMSWIRESLELPSVLENCEEDQSCIKKANLSFQESPQSYSPLYYYNKFLLSHLDMKRLLNYKCNWDAVLNSDLGLPKETCAKLISKRPEFQTGTVLEPTQRLMVEKLKVVLNKILGDENDDED